MFGRDKMLIDKFDCRQMKDQGKGRNGAHTTNEYAQLKGQRHPIFGLMIGRFNLIVKNAAGRGIVDTIYHHDVSLEHFFQGCNGRIG